MAKTPHPMTTNSFQDLANQPEVADKNEKEDQLIPKRQH